MTGIDALASQLQRTIEEKDKNKITGYDTQAEVTRVSDDTIWVKIPGGTDETPVGKTVSCKEGDLVQIRVSGHRAWITGNYTAPATDDAKAIEAAGIAEVAEVSANNAIRDAANANDAANFATEKANEANDAANFATEKANEANDAAIEARTYADEANTQAISATSSANSALGQLGIVQDVVGVLELLSKNGNYELTEDTEVVEGKWYFTRDGESPNYEYIVVTTPLGDPHDQGWYELTSIDASVKSYLTSRIAVTSDGMWIQDPTMSTKILLSPTDGVVLVGVDGSTIGKYGSTVQLGEENGFHIQMDGSELGFYQGATKVAYINNNQLYITKSVVLQQMDLGTPMSNSGLGQWSWKVHPNGETPSRNNLNLKWVG